MVPIRDDAQLIATLESLRPAAQDEFLAELDGRAGAGFHSAHHRRFGSGSRLRARLARLPRRRIPAFAAAAAVGAIAIVTAVIALSEGPQTRSGISKPIDRAAEGAAAPARSAGGAAGEEFSQEGQAASAAPSAGSARATGPYASQAEHRKIERSAGIVLEAPPSELRADAARVFDAVREYDGIVVRSSVSGGPGGGRASFDLLIPTARLGDALATLSQVADVISRQDSSQDVTARSIGLSERLGDARAAVKSLLRQLADAETEAERSAAEAELHAARGQLAAIRSRLKALERRVHLTSVRLRIEAGSAAADGGSSWGIDDALGSAGHILSIAAGVTLIAAACLAPLAVLILLAWWARRALLRRARERVLDSAR
jgi:uncharacterized protein DUF4349